MSLEDINAFLSEEFAKDQLSPELAQKFMELADKIVRPSKFTYKTVNVETAVEAACKHYKLYDPLDGKTPFAFIVCMMKNSITHKQFQEKFQQSFST